MGWTHDGGTTWKTTSIPVEGGLILSGLAFADMQNGMLTMDSQFGITPGRESLLPTMREPVSRMNDPGKQYRKI